MYKNNKVCSHDVVNNKYSISRLNISIKKENIETSF